MTAQTDRNHSNAEFGTVYVVDAKNGPERRYIQKALEKDRGNHDLSTSPQIWPFDLQSSTSHARLDAFRSVLANRPDSQVIPVRLVWNNPDFAPDKMIKFRHLLFGDPRRPGPVRSWLRFSGTKSHVELLFGEGALVSELEQRFAERTKNQTAERQDEFATFVLRQANLTLDIDERKLRGSRYKIPSHVAREIESSSQFLEMIDEQAKITGEDGRSLRTKAQKILKELIPNTTALFIDLRARMDKFVLALGYKKGVVQNSDEFAELSRTIRKHPTLILFTHKSYVDGFVPQHMLYKNDMPMLHTFGGINLDIPFLGRILRGSGAIFIRRSFADDTLYKLSLRHYIAYLMEKRFPLSWAFEGGRSRLGKLMPPRYGLLKYVLEASHAADVENLHIYPMVTSMDLIRDVEEYAAEQKGRAKQPESFRWFVGYLRSLRKPMGRIYVDLADPIILPKVPDVSDTMKLSRIAFKIAVHANRATPITLNALMCFCLLGVSPRAMTADELRRTIVFLVGWCRHRGIRLTDELTTKAALQTDNPVDRLVDYGLITRISRRSKRVYAIEPQNHALASYYRNSISHHFLEKATIELALLHVLDCQREHNSVDNVEIFWRECFRMRELFKFEFFYPEKDEYRSGLEAELDRTDPNWRERLESGGLILNRTLHRLQPLVSNAVLLPFVESYVVVLEVLVELETGEAMEKGEIVKQCLGQGKIAYLLRSITSEASIIKLLFENGVRLAENFSLLGTTTDEIREQRFELLIEFQALSRRLERARVELLSLADKQTRERE